MEVHRTVTELCSLACSVAAKQNSDGLHGSYDGGDPSSTAGVGLMDNATIDHTASCTLCVPHQHLSSPGCAFSKGLQRSAPPEPGLNSWTELGTRCTPQALHPTDSKPLFVDARVCNPDGDVEMAAKSRCSLRCLNAWIGIFKNICTSIPSGLQFREKLLLSPFGPRFGLEMACKPLLWHFGGQDRAHGLKMVGKFVWTSQRVLQYFGGKCISAFLGPVMVPDGPFSSLFKLFGAKWVTTGSKKA